MALVHSSLYNLAIPLIYNRFDIVWPETSSSGAPRGGVDALTYGLATLVLSQEMYGEGAWAKDGPPHVGTTPATDMQIRRRRGNHFAQHIKKFSIGNGPWEWVREYLTTKEGGKMLGTLVAVALARMKNMDTFIWDMPTGILRDVWTSLSYLGDRGDGQPCKLDKIWVRCHRNARVTSARPALTTTPPTHMYDIDQSNSLKRVEYPSYSQLPPLRSLSVLQIDEMQYLDEMSVLIGKSMAKLKELRVGIARHCHQDDWTVAWSGDSYEQIDLSNPIRSTMTVGGRRRGGVLGVLTSSFLDLKQRETPKHAAGTLRRRSRQVPLIPTEPSRTGGLEDAPLDGLSISAISPATKRPPIPSFERPETEPPADHVVTHSDPTLIRKISEDSLPAATPLPQDDDSNLSEFVSADVCPSLRHVASDGSLADDDDELPRHLKLEILALAYIQLSTPVLTAAIDWTMLTSLTLLDCQGYEQLWTSLHDEYSKDLQPTRTLPRKMSSESSHTARLKLKYIHLNTVTPAFVRFVHDCLAPNSLESLFLQEMSGAVPKVPLDDIFTNIIKRHQLSLKCLLLDSCKRNKSGKTALTNGAWKTWALNTNHLRYITNGKLPQLRELGFCIRFSRDWFYFIQRLPRLTKLRSIYIPQFASFFDSPDVAPRELAEYILDAVDFNRTMPLTYIGIEDKCFEVLEGEAQPSLSRPSSRDTRGDDMSPDDDDDLDPDDPESDFTDNDSMLDMLTPNRPARRDVPAVTTYDFEPSEPDSDLESVGHEHSKIHYREILFYEDMVPIFKVRNGRL